MISLKKLNARGASHIIALMGVIVLSGIIGSYLLVASHADSCGTSNPTSGVSDPVSGGCVTSGPVSPPEGNVSCVINGVVPNPSYGQVLSPTATVTNGTNETQTLSVLENFAVPGGGNNQTLTLSPLAAGSSTTFNLSQYTVRYADANSTAAQIGSYTVSTSHVMYCSESFTLPVQPLSYKASCTIDGIAASLQTGTTINPTVTVTNTGTGSTAPILKYYYVATQSGQQSPLQTLNMASLSGGQSITVNLASYRPTTSYTQPFRLSVSSNASGTNFNCLKTFNVTVPTVKSVTLNAADWNLTGHAKIIKDGSRTNVVRINKNTAKVYATISTTKPLTKLSNFVYADLGKKATLCFTARASSYLYTKQLQIYLNKLAPTKSSPSYVNLTTSYANHCLNITIPNDAYYGSVAQITLGNPTTAYYIYIANATLTLQ